jgi:serine/threonine protein kinase
VQFSSAASGTQRRYRVLGVVGEGGFGRVYKARLESDGFAKDVAIKLLRDGTAPHEILQRLRDESRILALVRDRALPGVDPPVLLEGRWAVVMEYVGGRSVAQLVRSHGPLPPSIALEIGAEVARLLDKVYRAPGPDGQPLRIVHRDLKPDNLQITPHGEVKVLDFGIARAEFEGREAMTRSAIAGTPGYMAPERMDGIEGPESDVFGLGVTLEAMSTGRSPSRSARREALDGLDPERALVVAFARTLAATEPEERPTARAVEERCHELRRGLSGPTLRTWAEVHVVESASLTTDDISGRILTERSPLQPPPPPRTLLPWFVATSVVVLGGGTLAAGVALALGFGVWWMAPAGGPAPDEVAAVEPPPVEPPGEVTRVAEPEPGPEPEPEPGPEPKPGPVPEATAPVTPARPSPRPTPRPTPAAPAASRRVAFGSDPLGAQVFVDGALVGTTPTSLDLPHGPHVVRMVRGAASAERAVEIGPRSAVKWVWLGGDQWSQRF